MARLLPLFILLLPFIEIAGFIVVGSRIGILATLGLLVASTALGIILMRIQGLSVLARIRADLARGETPDRQLVHGLMIVLAGVLLVLPGFLTDIIGLALFIPAVRDVAWRLVRSRIVVVSSGGTWMGGARGTRRRTIDLDDDEFSRRRQPPSDRDPPLIDHER